MRSNENNPEQHPLGAEPEELQASLRDYFAGRTPEQVVVDAVNAAIWDGAYTLVEAPQLGAPEWVSWKADPAAQAEVHLHAARLAHHVGLPMVGWVRNARRAGVTWPVLASLLDLDEAEARSRYAAPNDVLTSDDGDEL